MDSPIQRVIGVWIVAFVLLLLGLPLAWTVGGVLVGQPFWILVAVVLATILAVLEALS